MEYELIRRDRRTIGAEIKGGRVIVRAPRNASDADIERFIRDHESWFRKHLAKAKARQEAKKDIRKLTDSEIKELISRAKAVFPERVAHFAPLVGVSYGRVTVRRQKTRWGSCTPGGDLSFNCLLMLAPPEVLDSVVVHELCHRKAMDHSPRFYAEVLRVMPDYREKHRWLKENGEILLAMGEK